MGKRKKQRILGIDSSNDLPSAAEIWIARCFSHFIIQLLKIQLILYISTLWGYQRTIHGAKMADLKTEILLDRKWPVLIHYCILV